MSGPRTIGVVIGPGPVAAVAEGLRAAVGLTLRGDRVELAIAAEALVAAGADGARAAATLALFDHSVRVVGRDADGASPALAADVVELWADAHAFASALTRGPCRRLHLLRPGHELASPGPADQVLHLPSPAARAATEPDVHDRLLDAILAADVALVW